MTLLANNMATTVEKLRSSAISMPVKEMASMNLSQTPGGSIYGTTPGGTRVQYSISDLLRISESPLSRTELSANKLASIPAIAQQTKSTTAKNTTNNAQKPSSFRKKTKSISVMSRNHHHQHNGGNNAQRQRHNSGSNNNGQQRQRHTSTSSNSYKSSNFFTAMKTNENVGNWRDHAEKHVDPVKPAKKHNNRRRYHSETVVDERRRNRSGRLQNTTKNSSVEEEDEGLDEFIAKIQRQGPLVDDEDDVDIKQQSSGDDDHQFDIDI